MARPGFRQHQKLRRLAHILALPIPYAWGLCECLWDTAYQSGNPVIGDSTDIELAAEWPGEPGKLTEVLLAVRLIDEVEPGKYAVHDLLENAPDFVRKRFERDQTRKHKYSPRRPAKDNEGGISPPNSDQFCRSAELGSTHSTAQHSTANNTPPTPPSGGMGGEKPAETKTSPDNSNTTPKRRKRAQQPPVAIPPELDTPEFRRAWDEWRQYRREAKKPLTPTGERKQLAQLAGWGIDRAIRAIEHSITKGWQGIFEPQQSRGDNRNGRSRGSRAGYRFDPPTVGEPSE